MHKILKIAIQLSLILLITLIVIEVLLQLAFMSLPQAIIQRMPQYPIRYGIQFDTSHGAREYPAKEKVDIVVNQYSGDLYQLSCLSPKDAKPLDPYSVQYMRDSHGFRNSEPLPDDVDLVVVGDSFTAAESIVHPYWEGITEKTFVLGLPGSGTLEQSLLLNAFGLPRHPETVVLAFFGGNDISDSEVFSNLQKAGMTFIEQGNQNRNPLDYLVTFNIALYIRDAISKGNAEPCYYPVIANTSPPTLLAFFDRLLPQLAIDKDSLLSSEAYQITHDAIINMANEVQASGARFILMYIPQKAEVYWNLLNKADQIMIAEHLPTAIDARALATEISNNLHVQRDVLNELAIEKGFDVLDLTPYLDTVIQQGQSPYFFADTHWNQTGHSIAHSALSVYLSEGT